jgi:hypothetical protein
VAAFILDAKRIHGVPETFFVELYHPYFAAGHDQDASMKNYEKIIPINQASLRDGVKYGSLQLLKHKDGESSDYSCKKFSVE